MVLGWPPVCENSVQTKRDAAAALMLVRSNESAAPDKVKLFNSLGVALTATHLNGRSCFLSGRFRELLEHY